MRSLNLKMVKLWQKLKLAYKKYPKVKAAHRAAFTFTIELLSG